MAIQTLDAQKLYTIVANTMPTEGRDFTISAKTSADGQTVVTVKPLTDVGHGFVPALLRNLSTQMGIANTVFTNGESAKAEVETINTIKAAVEANAMIKLRTRLAEAQKRQKTLAEEMTREDKERGKRALTSQEAEKRSQDMSTRNRARMQENQLAYMLKHMSEAREQISAVARAAAEADAKAGNDMAVDRDAPLTTLFDKEDVTRNMDALEIRAQQLATHMFMADTVKSEAATIGKRYALQK